MAQVDYSTLPSELEVTREGAVRIVTLNRPERRNAINADLHEALAELWLLLEKDLDARAVLIRARGDIFTAGGDYEWFREQQNDRQLMEAAMQDGRRILYGMVACRLPIVTAIQGGAVGLGASIGVLSDLVIMSDDAFYRDPHVMIGLAAGDGGVAWTRSVGMQIAKQYVLLGDRLPAKEAYRLGMINLICSRDELDDRGLELVRRLAALPERAVTGTKRAFNMQIERELHGVADYLLAVEHLCATDPSFGETTQTLGGSNAAAG